MRRKIKKMDCIEYLSVQAPLEKVNMLEDKQSKYIHEFVKRKEYSIVGKIRRNGFSQRDVDRQWNQIVNMIRKKQISGVVVANMAAISSSVADAYFKVGLVIEAGGIVVTVDEGRLDIHYKERGLAMSGSLKSVVTKYERDNDLVLQFLENRCERVPEESSPTVIKAKDLYNAFKIWAKSEGAYILSARKFNSEMERHPEWFDRKSTSSGYVTYCGLKLKEVL